MKKFRYTSPFTLECGVVLDELEIAYHTYGKLNQNGDNCIWVCHALTADSDVKSWWPHTVEKGGFLDPDKYFIVCANIIGSCYGSTGPMSINPIKNLEWFGDFPPVTIRDIVKAHILLADYLKLSEFKAIIGSSLGGFQVLEWAMMQPNRFKNLILIATSPIASPWTIALNETQRMAIFADQTYGIPSKKAGSTGLAAARAIGLLSYRGPDGYNTTQKDTPENLEKIFPLHRASTYQQHQGKKLVNRFDAYSYVTILGAFDSHNIGRGRGEIDSLLKSLEMPVLSVSISTDILFPPQEMKDIADKIPNARYAEINSRFGHDGFLVEHEALNTIINEFLN